MNVFLVCVCASATGLSLGVGLKHHHDLKKLTDTAYSVSSAPAAELDIQTNSTPKGLQTEAGKHISSQSTDQVQAKTGLDRSDFSPNLAGQLQHIEAQQNSMLRQQAELNRELNAIQFRLDTHSSSFRPLRANSGPTRQPNIDFNFENNPLLPPLSQ